VTDAVGPGTDREVPLDRDGTSPDAGSEWWTTSDVAAYLGVRVATVTNYRKRGQMPAPDGRLAHPHVAA